MKFFILVLTGGITQTLLTKSNSDHLIPHTSSTVFTVINKIIVAKDLDEFIL